LPIEQFEQGSKRVSGTISNEQALIYVMVMMSVVEGHINPDELSEIELLIRRLPAFKSFDRARLATIARECGDILEEKEGMKTVLALVTKQLPHRLKETAYALAVEVAASDLVVGKEELRFLAILRDALGLDKLVTAALERSAIARYQPV
jgi:tellurite resistance protein